MDLGTLRQIEFDHCCMAAIIVYTVSALSALERMTYSALFTPLYDLRGQAKKKSNVIVLIMDMTVTL